MKKLLVCLVVLITLFGCSATSYAATLRTDGGRQIFDTSYTKYDYAYVKLPNGECVEGKVWCWTDCEDSDWVQVTLEDGKMYSTTYNNVVLVKVVE